MTPEALRTKIDLAIAAMQDAIDSYDQLPAGCLDMEDDSDIPWNLSIFRFAMEADMGHYSLADHIYGELQEHPAVRPEAE